MKKSNASEHVKKITVLAAMTALAVICSSNFPYGLTVRVGSFMKLSPVFIVIAVVASIYGATAAALVAFLSDLIQSLTAGLGLSPSILIISALTGLCFGLFLRGNRLNTLNIALSVLVTQLVGGLVLTTAVLCIRYGLPFSPTIYWRLLQTVILIAIEIPILKLLLINLDLPYKLKKQK